MNCSISRFLSLLSLRGGAAAAKMFIYAKSDALECSSREKLSCVFGWLFRAAAKKEKSAKRRREMKENAFSVRWPMEQVRMSRAIRTEKNNEIPNQTVARFRCCKELKAFRSRGEAKLSVVARFVVSLIARQPKRASQDRSSG